MGVTGLWTVLQPCARPIKLETLNKKRLAVDASIWIYQFLKAVRDKEGNALRNAHVVGFFRRICKLLFFGIKPVFVFDGGAPILKRQTISERKARREGRREDAIQTAGKLLAIQMKRRAEEEERQRKEERDRPTVEDEEEVPENLVYVEELQMTERERQQSRKFKKTDAYHLPDLDVSLSEMGAPDDLRIMSTEELEEYASQFHKGEDVSIYDFSKIDFNGPFFQSLPASDRYNILNAARLRSRLRMGYSKDQLDSMFPDRMAFSRFQIDRVRERNELTQRLMNLNGMNGEDPLGIGGSGRIAGEKGKEYVLVKNDGVEGGWALGVVSNKSEGERNKPIDVDRLVTEAKADEDEDDGWEDDGFEDVPIEGLNRLPKRVPGQELSENRRPVEAIAQRRDLYQQRRQEAASKQAEDDISDDGSDSLFVASPRKTTAAYDKEVNQLFEDVSELMSDDDEEDLRQAIALSLQSPTYEGIEHANDIHSVEPNTDPGAEAGEAFAHVTEEASARALEKPGQYDEQDDFDLQAALHESRQSKYQPRNSHHIPGSPKASSSLIPHALTVADAVNPAPAVSSSKEDPKTSVFDGPLPFESVKWVKKIFTKKKKKHDPGVEGGFEKELDKQGPMAGPKLKSQPLPPWFLEDLSSNITIQKGFEDTTLDPENVESVVRVRESVLNRKLTGKIIDLEAPMSLEKTVVEIHSSSDDDDDILMKDVPPTKTGTENTVETVHVNPPSAKMAPATVPSPMFDASPAPPDESTLSIEELHEEDVAVEWEESDLEQDNAKQEKGAKTIPLISANRAGQVSRSSTPEFENIEMLESAKSASLPVASTEDQSPDPILNRINSFHQIPEQPVVLDDDDDFMYSDPEDEDLMRQLAVEAEEHARFASTLNAKTHLQSADDYERELRQLRNQQKKDRRDADEVSHVMVTECQQLLKLFGIPYITAPMEAEAQCAELVNLGLVDGIVTDDSDIFLFGGTRVYKNMFNQAKYVECYLASDLEKEYSLTRDKIIQIAHLLGSDYTEGLPSVGPVTALEILSEFKDLEAFRDWWEQVQTGRKPDDAGSAFRRKFKRNATKLFLPTGFPNKLVDEAYLHPEVDRDTSPFAWGVPDLDHLRQFLIATIGWTQERTDEILIPVIRDMNRRENEGTQANITRFFEGAVGVGARNKGGNASFAPRRRGDGKSKRMETALGRLHDQARNRGFDDAEVAETGVEIPTAGSSSIEKEAEVEMGPPKRRRTAKRVEHLAGGDGDGDDGDDGDDAYDNACVAPRKTKKRKQAGPKRRGAASNE
jgi:DNA excision repair protein ERCC-5